MIETNLSLRCSVVLYNSRKNRQNHIINTAKKTITSVGFTDDGRYLVTGECGHLPMVRIWDAHERQLVAEFPGHKFGINCVVSNHSYLEYLSTQARNKVLEDLDINMNAFI